MKNALGVERSETVKGKVTMGDLTKHFSRSEFACKCGCGFDTVDVDTLALLESIREYFMSPVTITSACRCFDHNAAVGGAKRSQHIYGRAVDIKIAGVSPIEISGFAETLIPDNGGIGIYENFCHLDTRAAKARWNG